MLRMVSAKGDYCHSCLEEIRRYRNGGERLPPAPKSEGHQIVDNWEGMKDWTHYRERSLCFGKRKPRIYIRPEER